MDEQIEIINEGELIAKIKEIYRDEYMANGGGNVGYELFSLSLGVVIIEHHIKIGGNS